MASPKLSSTLAHLKPAVFAQLQGRIDNLAARGQSLIPLHIGDTYKAPPEGARRVISDLSGDDASLFRYGATSGLAELRARMALSVSPEVCPESELLIGNGATHALSCAARAIFDPGDEVLLASPYWPLAPGIFTACGALPIDVPLTQALYAGTITDAGAPFAQKIGPRTKAIYLATPNNPDGKMLSRRELEHIAQVAREHDLWVISDEVYRDTTFGAEHVSIASLSGMRERTLVVHSLSKSHALAGCRVGFVIAPKEVVSIGRRVSTHSAFNVSVAMQRAALAALEDESFAGRAAADYATARDAVGRALGAAAVSFHVAEGATYLFVDFARAFERLPRPLAGEPPLLVALLERAVDRGVLLAPGNAFGHDWATSARLCFTAAPLDEVLVGVDRLLGALDALVRGKP